MWEGPWISMAAEPERASTSSAEWASQLRTLARLIDERSSSRAPSADVRTATARAVRGRLAVSLEGEAEPFGLILVASLQAGLPPLRWGVAVQPLDAAGGTGDQAQTQAAAAVLDECARRGEPIAVSSGDPLTDALLADLTPGFAALLAGLTGRQREVGRLLVADGRRRSEVATVLGISRPTVSVMVARARLPEIERFARGLDAILLAGVPRTRGSQ